MAAAVAAYVVTFAVLAPDAVLVSDEAEYIGQATLFADGRVAEAVRDPLSGLVAEHPVSDYPVGTALLQAPFVALGGWRAASAASVLGLAATVGLLSWWLARLGRPPLWALVVLAFPPALVMGRLGMSDVPSMAVVTAALALFWTARSERRRVWLVAGFLGGVATTWREPNLLFVVAPFAGAALRRQRGAWQLAVGVAAGIGVRLALSALVFDDPLYVKPPGEYGGGLGPHLQALLLLVVALVVLLPTGLVAVAAYRGIRRVELVATVGGAVAAYTAYGYAAAESGWPIRLVLVPRFVLPAVPLVIVALADVAPRWRATPPWRHVLGPAARAPLATAVALTVVVAVLGVAVQTAVHRRGEREASITRVVYGVTDPGDTLVINYASLTKHVSRAFGRRTLLDRGRVDADGLVRLAATGPVRLVFLDRTDSAFRRAEAAANQDFLDRAGARCRLTTQVDAPQPTGDRLRITAVACDP